MRGDKEMSDDDNEEVCDRCEQLISDCECPDESSWCSECKSYGCSCDEQYEAYRDQQRGL